MARNDWNKSHCCVFFRDEFLRFGALSGDILNHFTIGSSYPQISIRPSNLEQLESEGVSPPRNKALLRGY